MALCISKKTNLNVYFSTGGNGIVSMSHKSLSLGLMSRKSCRESK